MSRPSSAIQIVRPPTGAAAAAAPTLAAVPVAGAAKTQGNGGLNVNASVFGQAASSTVSPDKRKGESDILFNERYKASDSTTLGEGFPK